MRGISMTGIETGTRETASGAGFWLFLSDRAPEAANAPTALANVVDALATWNPSVVRIARMGNGTDVDRGTFTSNGQTHEYSEFEDGSTGINKIGAVDSSAPSDWYTADAATWQCPISNADGVTMHNAYYNKDNIAAMWRDIAAR